MDILELSLVNFRNFLKKNIEFDKKLTVIVGPNGSGKSNILEAICLLSGARSERVETDLDLVSFGKDEAKIESRVKSQSEERKLAVNFVSGDGRVQKAYFVDSIKKRLADFLNICSIIVFTPFDLDLVSGSPSLRRHHLDSLLSSLDKNYWRNNSLYGKVLTRRNKILQKIREGSAKQNELNFWDERLAEHGKFIERAREDFFEFLNLPFVASAPQSFTPGVSSGRRQGNTPGVLAEGLRFELKQSLINEEKMLKNRERDIAAGITLSGPQRDDFRFKMGANDLEYFGSRGEQRMAVLALKMAELEYFQLKMGSRPILGLDDIFSELDWEHREAVLSVIDKQQTIITAAEVESVPKNLLNRARVLEL